MTSVSDGDDVSMTSSTQNMSKKANYSTLVKGNPQKGKTTAVVAVMMGNSKHGYHCHRSNKHYKKQIVWVLLDSGSDGYLVFVKQRQAHVASLLKKAGSTVVEYFEWDLPN
jgi:hypothetical protein